VHYRRTIETAGKPVDANDEVGANGGALKPWASDLPALNIGCAGCADDDNTNLQFFRGEWFQACPYHTGQAILASQVIEHCHGSNMVDAQAMASVAVFIRSTVTGR
jgi:hypothetical protein